MSKGFSDSKMAPPAPAPAAPTAQGTCVLGPTLHFKGELYGEEDLEFQGQIEGSIEHTRSLSIGKEGGVKGNIRAKFVIIEGKVEGDAISFSINASIQGNEMKLTYKGRIAGDTIKLTSDFAGGGQTIEWTLKKAS